MYKAFLAALAVASLSVSWAQAEPALKLGNNPESFDLKAFFQPRYDLSYQGGEALVNSFSVRRGYVTLTGEILPGAKGRLQINAVPDKVELLEASVAWTFPFKDHKPLVLTAGQFKKPLSYQEFVMSSSNLNLIDRPRTNEFLEKTLKASSWDQGVMLTGDLWEYDVPALLYAGVWNGNGKGVAKDSDRNKQAVVRAEVVPLTGFTVGGSASMNWVHGETDTSLNVEGTESYLVWGLEGVWGRGNAQVVAEVVGGDNYKNAFGPVLPTDPSDFLSWYAEAIYRFKSGWEPAARVEVFDPNQDAEDDKETILTGQITHSFSPNLRWQLNVLYRDFEKKTEDAVTEVVNQLTIRI